MRLRDVLLRLHFVKPTRDEFIASIRRTGRTVDFTVRGWGHNLEGGAAWCSPRLVVGDEILTERGRFVAAKVKPAYDPPDMVFAEFLRVAESSPLPASTTEDK